MSDKTKKPAGPGLNMAPNGGNVEKMKEEAEIADTLSKIKNKIIILSGKGGVGKSTVSVNIAASLAAKGKKVGLLDIDMHGPSVPKMLGINKHNINGNDAGKLKPVEYSKNLKVISVGLLMQNEDEAVIWRGALKHGVIKQFIKDVIWGDLDYLIIDSPPGTGDEPLSILQLLKNPEGAIIVTTPQDVALIDVRKSVTFCRKMNTPILGVVENMSGFICPHCGEKVDIFKSGGGEAMAKDMNIPFLGAIPIEPGIVVNGDSGKPFIDSMKESNAAKAFSSVVEKIIK